MNSFNYFSTPQIGKLCKGEYNEWIVNSGEYTYQLHPNDVEELMELDRVFDNLNSRIAENPEVKFDIIHESKLSGVVTYAKLKKI